MVGRVVQSNRPARTYDRNIAPATGAPGNDGAIEVITDPNHRGGG
jgi:hypothetical protein